MSTRSSGSSPPPSMPRHCISCANGTDALYIAMAALKVKPGDEVITTAHSWISTSAMITHAGATPVFCDTDAQTFTIDPAAIESAITPRTVGIIPVHLYGQPADMDAIMAIARRHKLWVIEDCAQAHLARFRDQQVGTFGDAATYSFYPGKNLGAMGDAGAIVTGRSDLAERMAMLARHGGLMKHQHQIEGINSRLDGLQAAILSAKLPHLPRWTKARQAAAAVYDAGLNQIENVGVPQVAPDRTHVYHLYTIQHPQRDKLAAHLSANGVQTAINYPVALPFLRGLPAFRPSSRAVSECAPASGPHPVVADVRGNHGAAAKHRGRSHSCFRLTVPAAGGIGPEPIENII